MKYCLDTSDLLEKFINLDDHILWYLSTIIYYGIKIITILDKVSAKKPMWILLSGTQYSFFLDPSFIFDLQNKS